MPTGPAAIDDLWLYLHLMFESIHDYRFLYRSLDDLVGRSRRLRERFNRIGRRKRDAIVELCEGLVGARLMRATPAEIRALAQNVLVVSTYWLNYRALGASTGGWSMASGINTRGQVVGGLGDHAVIWEAGKVTDLGTLGGVASFAADINERGQVLTYVQGSEDEYHFVLWEAGRMTRLETPEGARVGVVAVDGVLPVRIRGILRGFSSLLQRQVTFAREVFHGFLLSALRFGVS